MEYSENLIQKFGYSEMYEWSDVPIEISDRPGRFVQFDKSNSDKIQYYKDENHPPIGITTVNSISDSDNPEEWKYAFICNEFGDYYVRDEKLVVGEKTYDQKEEFSYIKTRPWEHKVAIESKYYDINKKYIKRTRRSEWMRVNLMGKVIVKDNGECKPGEYCTPNIGTKLKKLQGIAIPAKENSKYKYYVISRITDSTIMILNKLM